MSLDPYTDWLGVSPGPRPPSPEDLLGVARGETDEETILEAAMRRKKRLDELALSEHSKLASEIAKEVADAMSLLLKRATSRSGHPASASQPGSKVDEVDVVTTAVPTPPKPAAPSDRADRLQAAGGERRSVETAIPPTVSRQPSRDVELRTEIAGAAKAAVTPPPVAAYPPALPPSSGSPGNRNVIYLSVALSVAVGMVLVLVAVLVSVLGRGHSRHADPDVVRSDESMAPHDTAHEAGPSRKGAKTEPENQLDSKQLPRAALKPPANGEGSTKVEPKGAQQTPGESRKSSQPPAEPPKSAAPEVKSPPKSAAERPPPASESMAAARTAMKQRNVAAARRHFLLAEKAASAQEKEQIDRLKEVLTLWEEFWAAVRNGILECKDREILRAERLTVEVVDRADGVITVRDDADGKKGAVTFGLQNLPAPLAVVLAEKKLPENTASLSKAAFLIVDPQGDPRQAMELCEQSTRRGTAPSPGLTAELKEALAAAGSPPDPGATSAKPPARLPVPDAATQQIEKKKVRDAFRARFAQARTPIDKGELAADLFRDAKTSKDSPAARFALFAEARDLTLAAGEPARFREIVLEMTKGYEIDSLEEQTRALVEASETALPSAVRTTLAKVAIGLAQDAVQADSYDAASQLAKAGFNFASKVMASKGRDPQIIRQASDLGETIPWYKEQRDLALKAEKSLAQDPNNVKAVQFLGKYYALVKEQWDRGLPLLLKGEDAALKALAEAEQAARRSATAADMVKLAGQWMEAAPSLEGPHGQSARQRALYWYEAALPHVSGVSREGVVRAIDAMKQSELPRRK